MSLALSERANEERSGRRLGLRWEMAGVLAITLLAGVLRFHRLGDWSFWGDETYTLRNAIDLANLNANYPLWYLISHVSVSSLGVSEWSARLPAAIVGVLTIPLVFGLLRQMCSSVAAMIAVALLAVSPWHLYWSQNARFYILLSLLTSLALLMFYWSIERDRPAYLVTSLALFGLAILTHPTALLSLGAAAAYLVVLSAQKALRPVGFNRRNILIIVSAATLPTLFLGLRVAPRWQSWLQFLEWDNSNPLWLASVVVYYLGVPVVCIALFSAVFFLWRGNRFVLLMALATATPIAAILAVSLFSYSASRYMFIAATPCISLAALGTAELLQRLPRNALWLGLGLVAILVVESLSEDVLYYQYQNGNRFDYRKAYQVVGQHLLPDDLVLANEPLLADHYLEPGRARSIANVELSELTAEGQRAWYVTEVPLHELDPRIVEWVTRDTVLVANLDVHARARNFVMRVYLYDPTKAFSHRAGIDRSQLE